MAKTSKTNSTKNSTSKVAAPSKPAWVDGTSYNRNEHGTIEPRTWRLGQTGIVVTRYSGLLGWYVRSHIDGIELQELTSTDIDAAKTEAIIKVRAVRASRLAELDSL